MKKLCLANGIRVLVDEIETVNSLAVGIMVHAGSKHEREETNGMVHFLEHILFKNKTSTNSYYNTLIENLGGRVNAFTGKEFTCFHMQILSEYAIESLKAMRDMVFSYEISDLDFEKEQQVILQEINKYKDDALEQTKINSLITALGNCSYSRDILGTAYNIKSFNKDTVGLFHKDYYVPSNTVVSISGKLSAFQLDKILALLMEIPSREGVSKGKLSFTPVGGLHYEKRNIQQAHLSFIFPVYSESIGINEYYAFILLNQWLGAGRNSRLNQLLREKNGFVYGVYSQPIVFEEGGFLRIVASTSDEYLDSVIKEISNIVNSIQDKGITQEEIDLSKAAIKSEIVFSHENTVNRMFFYGQEEILGSYKSFNIEEILQTIDNISVDDILSIGERIIDTPFALAVVSKRESLNITKISV